MTENDKYRNAHYPDLHPCVDGCKYWRPLFAGTYIGNTTKGCHYNLDENELRDEAPDLIHGTCKHYVKGKGQGKKTNPMLKIRKRG